MFRITLLAFPCIPLYITYNTIIISLTCSNYVCGQQCVILLSYIYSSGNKSRPIERPLDHWNVVSIRCTPNTLDNDMKLEQQLASCHIE